MDLAECREPFSVVPFEEEVDTPVGVYAEELSNDLYGYDLCIGELRSGTALTVALLTFFKSLIYETEDSHDEGVKIHEKTSATFGAIGVNTKRREVFFVAQVFKETCTRG